MRQCLGRRVDGFGNAADIELGLRHLATKLRIVLAFFQELVVRRQRRAATANREAAAFPAG